MTYTFDTAAPGVTITTGPASDITTNQTFTVQLTTDEANGCWSTNGSSWNSFDPLSPLINITQTTSLRYYGEDNLGNTSATNSVLYTLNFTPPLIAVTAGKPAASPARQSFTLTITVTNNKDFGYWSTNAVEFYAFNPVTNIFFSGNKITNDFSIFYYGEDSLGNNSGTNSNVYTLVFEPPAAYLTNIADNSILYGENQTLAGTASSSARAITNIALFFSNDYTNFYFTGITPQTEWLAYMNTFLYKNRDNNFFDIYVKAVNDLGQVFLSPAPVQDVLIRNLIFKPLIGPNPATGEEELLVSGLGWNSAIKIYSVTGKLVYELKNEELITDRGTFNGLWR
ncbi:MAG TPA: hypothetical protein VKS21_04960, partial [Spirochaetota bacterium]|nr:hypothetical protein [Spirochaetota bacterium]